MSQSAKSKAYERPLYSGRTSLLHLGLGWHIFRLVIWSILVTVLAVVLVWGIVARDQLLDTITGIVGNDGSSMTYYYIVMGAITLVFIVVLAFAIGCYRKMIKFLSNIHYDPEIFGLDGKEKISSKKIHDHADHSRLKFIYFRIYKDRVVINDYTGLHEWIYLLKGTYHIRVRQSFNGRAFNYGTVVLASAGFGGRTITFTGIKDPHGLKSYLEANMLKDKVGVGVMIPH